MQSLSLALGYGVLATLALNAGGVVAVYWPPTAKALSYTQHLAAGFVFAAAAVEVLPDVMHRHQPIAVAIGFAAGVAMTLAIRVLSEGLDGSGNDYGYIAVLVADLLIDGLLIGVAANSGAGKTGLLVAVAVSVELLALGLSMAATLRDKSRFGVLGVTGGVSLAPLLGVGAGYFLGGALNAGWLEATLAFAVAVFLFMATEELLKDAHEAPETPLGTSLFFVAFLCVLLLDMAGSG